MSESAVRRVVPRCARAGEERATETSTIRSVRLAICALVMFFIQGTLAHRFSYGILRFDLLYVLAAYVALEANPRGALVSALLIGLLRDMGSGGAVGISAVVMSLGAAGLLTVRDHVSRELVLADVMLVFVFAFCCGAVEATGVALFHSSAQWGELTAQAFGQAALTAVLCPFLFAVCRRVGVVDRQSRAHAG